ncbi:hypothetical protein Pcinc_007347 [Petrolisthes cinctipes]|uniref:U-box domain-containing protein n=1 Tax=Petrolisthes cinctipes TaxID=88211 RepID=A0AAE1KYN3_PETCI|nr:hypothetical protein Pcinc_007347 [Petrolisthes cinctipes]
MEANNNNNNDTHHQHQPSAVTSILNQARQDLDSLRKEGETTTRNYWNVLYSIVKMFTTNLCSQEFLQCIKLAWKTIMAIRMRTSINVKFSKMCLADDALLCLARLDVKVTGLWEDAISFVIALVRVSDGADNTGFSFFASYDVKRWILSVFCDAEVCPNYNIRLDMLMLIQVWCRSGVLGCQGVSERVITGLMELSVYMDGEDEGILRCTGLTLELSWCRVIYALKTKGHLTEVYKTATQQIQSLSVGPEARWLARVVEFVTARISMVKSNLHSRYMTPTNALQALELSLVLLGHLVISCGSADTFSSRGFSRVGAVSFIKVCVNVLEVIPSLWSHHANSCNLMLTSISEMIETLTSLPKPQPLVQVLTRDHNQEMDKIRRSASDLGFQMPVLTPNEDHIITQCPERFVDGVTQSIMESPVLLQTSQVTVDETTLVYLLLQKSPRCPFTRATLDQHSFCRLPELQQEIHDWKTDASTTSSTS